MTGFLRGCLTQSLVLARVFLRLMLGTPLPLTLKRFLVRLVILIFHIFVADVVKSFETVERDILDCTLGRLGLPAWFRKVYFSFHRDVRLRFKLAAGLGVAWKRDGSIPQGCPLSVVFIIALYTPWCRYLESRACISPQLYAA